MNQLRRPLPTADRTFNVAIAETSVVVRACEKHAGELFHLFVGMPILRDRLYPWREEASVRSAGVRLVLPIMGYERRAEAFRARVVETLTQKCQHESLLHCRGQGREVQVLAALDEADDHSEAPREWRMIVALNEEGNTFVTWLPHGEILRQRSGQYIPLQTELPPPWALPVHRRKLQGRSHWHALEKLCLGSRERRREVDG
mmetsp:Transcript_108393/g.291113  ORF Transcript_108393/g.291113 Transcript_108393/m.291113 type:complete len:202 (-) Transcript_108393:235-840(-)